MIQNSLHNHTRSSRLSRQYADGGLSAGFPAPLLDHLASGVDLNRELIRHPSATVYARVEGDAMAGEGITAGDIIVIDRSLKPEHGDLAVCCLDGEFLLNRLCFIPGGGLRLFSSIAGCRPVQVGPDDDFMVWGVVTHTIKANRRRRKGTERW